MTYGLERFRLVGAFDQFLLNNWGLRPAGVAGAVSPSNPQLILIGADNQRQFGAFNRRGQRLFSRIRQSNRLAIKQVFRRTIINKFTPGWAIRN